MACSTAFFETPLPGIKWPEPELCSGNCRNCCSVNCQSRSAESGSRSLPRARCAPERSLPRSERQAPHLSCPELPVLSEPSTLPGPPVLSEPSVLPTPPRRAIEKIQRGEFVKLEELLPENFSSQGQEPIQLVTAGGDMAQLSLNLSAKHTHVRSTTSRLGWGPGRSTWASSFVLGLTELMSSSATSTFFILRTNSSRRLLC